MGIINLMSKEIYQEAILRKEFEDYYQQFKRILCTSNSIYWLA